MSNVVNIADQQALDLEAATWVTKLDARRLEPSEFSAFKAWMDQSSAHSEAFERTATMWGKLDILAELQDEVRAPQPASLIDQFKNRVNAWMPRPQLAFATAALVVAIGFSFYMPRGNVQPPTSSIFATAVGEHKNVSLSDGSTVLLNTASQVDVQFTDDRRILKLVKGEAHFNVAHNPNRPFEVHAGTNIVRAVGTAFTVELKAETVEVTVTEGRVELATVLPAGTPNSPQGETSLALVSSGQSAHFSDYIHSIDTIEKIEVDRRLSWHKGALIFEGDPLDQVIREVSRYTKTQIVISDPTIRDLKVGGYFKTGETEAMLKALEANFGVSVEWVTPELVYLSQSKKD